MEHGTTPIRVRFAPSPTGALHVGSVRTTLFNWLYAKKNGGTFVLRIDDTDEVRSSEQSLEQILRSFDWLGIRWDEGPDVGGPYGPYRQSERLDLYAEELRKLLAAGKAYPCFCSLEQLRAEREAQRAVGQSPRYSGRCRHLSDVERNRLIVDGGKPAYRFRWPDNSEVTVVHDVIRGDVTFEGEQDDFVIFKGNGMPLYHFASVVDDAKMNITHIIRADEHLSNTPNQIRLFEALGYTVPTFAHVPMILAPDRSKLSKRHGATSVEEFKEGGYLPQAIVNYLLLLGWSPGENRELFDVNEAVEVFSLERVNKNAAVYDVKKLEWMNGKYIRDLPFETLWAYLFPLVEASDIRIPADVLTSVKPIVEAVRERANTMFEIVDGMGYFFAPVATYDEKGFAKYFTQPAVVERLRTAAKRLQEVEPFGIAETEVAYRGLIDEWGIKGGELIHPTRLALSGRTVGPGLFDIMALLGKDRTVERLLRAADVIEQRTTIE